MPGPRPYGSEFRRLFRITWDPERMIITCPQCATCYDTSDEFIVNEGQELDCPDCGYQWQFKPGPIKKPDLPQVTELFPANIQALDTGGLDVAAEAVRLKQASGKAQSTFDRLRRQRVSRMRKWAALAVCVLVTVSACLAAPGPITRLFPAAAQLYAHAGVVVNLRGMEISDVSYIRNVEDGLETITVKGLVENISGHDMNPDELRFALLDGADREVYTWTVKLDGNVLKPEASVAFMTTLAFPPVEMDRIQIRLAQTGEIS